MASFDVIPTEVLCNILERLSTKEKFQARQVCRVWRNTVDELVPFYNVNLNNENYNDVALRFGTCQVVSLELSECDQDYTRLAIPIQNLSYLQRVLLMSRVSVEALGDLATRAVNLKELGVNTKEANDWHEVEKTSALLPALHRIKTLLLFGHFNENWKTLFHAWKPILFGEMGQLNRLEIDLSRRSSHYTFELPILEPNLCELAIQSGDTFGSDEFCTRITAVWNVKCKFPNSDGLRKLKITDAGCLVLHERTQWENLISSQRNLQEFQLCDPSGRVIWDRWTMPIIQLALKNNMKSLHTIRLSVDTMIKGIEVDFDMEIFAPLESLHDLHVTVKKVMYMDNDGKRKRYLRGIKNCSTIISGSLTRLVLHGFKFGAEDANECIKKMAELDLEKVDFSLSSVPEILQVWKEFGCRAKEMGLKKEAQINTFYLPDDYYGIEFYFKV